MKLHNWLNEYSVKRTKNFIHSLEEGVHTDIPTSTAFKLKYVLKPAKFQSSVECQFKLQMENYLQDLEPIHF